MKVTSNRKAWEKLKKKLTADQNYHTKVGWFADQRYGDDNDNLQLAQVASWNEFGHETAGMFAGGVPAPPRPFMRVWYVDELKGSKHVYTAMQWVAMNAYHDRNVSEAMDKAGPIFVDALQETMLRFDDPPNSDATIALKGFDDPLIETSQLVSSVRHEVGRKSEDT